MDTFTAVATAAGIIFLCLLDFIELGIFWWRAGRLEKADNHLSELLESHGTLTARVEELTALLKTSSTL